MNVAAIAEGLKRNLATVDGLRPHDAMPDSIAPPAAVVLPMTDFLEPHGSFGNGIAEMHWRVTLLVSRTSLRAAHATLYGFLSSGSEQATSVIDAIESDQTLGGEVDSLMVEAVNDYGIATVAGTEYLKADLVVHVLARRST